jgi:hypothetical protein
MSSSLLTPQSEYLHHIALAVRLQSFSNSAELFEDSSPARVVQFPLGNGTLA